MSVRRSAAAALLGLLLVCGAASAAEHSVLVPIQTYVRAANAGDRALLISAFTSDSLIVDEFAPFRFPAPNAAAHWYDGFGADQLKSGVTDALISSTPPKFVTIEGTHAYVVLPTVYTYKIHGKPAKETGSLAFALVKRGSQWKISSMAWAKITDSSIP
jgi:ketosteroid isomerase-like protein